MNLALKDKATKVTEAYCISRHGEKKQKGKVQLDALETIDSVDLQELFRTINRVEWLNFFVDLGCDAVKVDVWQPSDSLFL